MRGNPPLQLTLALIVFILLAIPLARLTFARSSSQPESIPAARVETAVSDTLLRVRFAHLPKRLSILLGGKVLMDSKTELPTSPVEINLKLTIPKDGVEIIINAEWPAGTPETALTLEMEPDGLETKRETRWSSGARINDVISFSW